MPAGSSPSLLSLVCGLAIACGVDSPRPAPPAADRRADAAGPPIAGAVEEKRDPADPGAAGADDGKEESTKNLLPAIDTACASDDDCGYVAVVLEGEHVCCATCTTTTGSKAWVAAVTSACEAMNQGRVGCFPLACPMGPTATACRAGRCVFVSSSVDGGAGGGRQ